MAACGIDTDLRAPTPRGRLLDQPRGPRPRLRGGADPPGLARPATGTTARPTCSGSASAPASSTAPTSHFLSGVGNPVGCKLGPTATPDEVVALCEALNPDRVPGRLTLITPHGRRPRGRAAAPAPAGRAARPGHPVVWTCDPMHGNTYTSGERKTRHFDDICREIDGFFTAHRAVGTWPGGIHVELTGDDVTECLGGGDDVVRARPPLRDDVRPSPQRRPVPRPRLPGLGVPAEPDGVTDSTEEILTKVIGFVRIIGNPEWSTRV